MVADPESQEDSNHCGRQCPRFDPLLIVRGEREVEQLVNQVWP
jgi:hypothetical protein